MVTAVVVVGSKKSGKTTTIEIITKELSKQGFKIAAVKHIPEPNFSVDKEGKDTWRFAQSGAKTVIGISAEEIAVIEKTNTEKLSLKEILSKCADSDFVFLEGFKGLVAKDKTVNKIVVVKSAEEALASVKAYESILAFTGPFSTDKLGLRIPYVDLPKNAGKLAELVKNVRAK